MSCRVCGGIVFCSGLCRSCYNKEYCQRPEVKAKLKQKMAEYAKHRAVRVTPLQAVSDFFSHFSNHNKFHSVEELEQTANNYVKAACRIEGNCGISKEITTNKAFLELKERIEARQ